MTGRLAGLLLGFAFGIVWATLGFGVVLLCSLLAFVGWLMGGVAQGSINLANIWQDLQGQGHGARGERAPV